MICVNKLVNEDLERSKWYAHALQIELKFNSEKVSKVR
jgi:hypothetical protein